MTVTNGTSGGQPTLVLTAGVPEFGDDRTEQMTINADSGIPIQSTGGQTGASPAGTVDCKVSRVTLANPLATLTVGTVTTAWLDTGPILGAGGVPARRPLLIRIHITGAVVT